MRSIFKASYFDRSPSISISIFPQPADKTFTDLGSPAEVETKNNHLFVTDRLPLPRFFLIPVLKSEEA